MTDLTLPIRIDRDSAPDDTLHVTASGLPVLIYNINGGGEYPVHGAIFKDGYWHPQSWTDDGHFLVKVDDDLDLRDRPKAKRGVWVAWFEDEDGRDFFKSYATQAEAGSAKHQWADLSGVSYIKEGDGLDTPADPPLWVDWAKLPEWAKWAAANESGHARLFWERPELGVAVWWSEFRSERLPPHLYRLAPGFDWRETLIQRPEGE